MKKDVYAKEYELWKDHAKLLNVAEFEGFFYEREIWWCVLGVNIGSEQDGTGKQFERPVLIIKKIRKDLAFIAPLTTKISNHPYRITTYSTGTDSQILLDQIRVISSKRLIRKICSLKTALFQEVIIKLAHLILEDSKDETPPKRRGISEPEGQGNKSVF